MYTRFSIAIAIVNASIDAPSVEAPSVDVDATDAVSLSLHEALSRHSCFDESFSTAEIISEIVASEASPDALDVPMFVMDLTAIIDRFTLWKKHMPNVEPWYAVKCNPDPVLVQTLMQLGVGFDCASAHEIDFVKSLGHPSSRIIYSHPTKPVSHLKHAKSADVSLTVFDNEDELIKIAKFYPEAQLLIRLAPVDDSSSQCPMSTKFGAHPSKVPELLNKAMELGLNVIGVHFHVGSGCSDASAYSDALIEARFVFDLATEYGYSFSLLDIGGGFPGSCDTSPKFEDIASVVNELLPLLFPDTRVIAEPGRFFPMNACKLVTRVVSKAKLPTGKIRYHLNDGVYGSFNCIIFDHAVMLPPWRLSDRPRGDIVSASIFGPTCDGFDMIAENCETLDELEVGDLIVWDGMGAYTSTAATSFNGFDRARYRYYLSRR